MLVKTKKGIRTMKKTITENKNVLLNENRKEGITMTNLNNLKKAELIELIGQLEAEKEQKKEKKFNIFNYTIKNIVDSYIKNGEKKEFSFNVKRIYDSEFTNDKGELVKLEGSRKVFTWLNKLGALKVVSYTETYTEEGKLQYEVHIKDFDINVEKEGKYGKYKLFANYYGNLKLAQ